MNRNVKGSHIQGKGLAICRCGITVDETEKSFRANTSSANVKRKSFSTNAMSLVTHKVSARPVLSPTERGRAFVEDDPRTKKLMARRICVFILAPLPVAWRVVDDVESDERDDAGEVMATLGLETMRRRGTVLRVVRTILRVD